MKLYRDPLFHFVVLGVLFFLVYTGARGLLATDETRQVVVSESDISLLAESWSRRWMRAPTEQELRGLVEARVREEILYREALKLGMDYNDGIVRRRMVQKMDLLSQDLSLLADPTDQELQEFFNERQDDYRFPPRLSFSHVYFNVDERGAAVEQDALLALDEIKRQNPAITSAPERGDRFILGYDYEALSPDGVAREFGGLFAEALFELESGWQGPIRSGFGIHLVYVGERIEARLPEIIEIRGRLVNNYNRWRQERAKEQLFEILSEPYNVEIDEEAILRVALKVAGPLDNKE